MGAARQRSGARHGALGAAVHGRHQQYLKPSTTTTSASRRRTASTPSLYIGGGLVDIRQARGNRRPAAHDTLFLGIAQVHGGAADGHGRRPVRRSRRTRTRSRASRTRRSIRSCDVRLRADAAVARDRRTWRPTGPTNVGPGGVRPGVRRRPAAWMRLAHTLKARFLMHTAEVRPTAYPQALAEASSGHHERVATTSTPSSRATPTSRTSGISSTSCSGPDI